MISIHYKETDFGDVDELVNFSLYHEEKRKAHRLPFTPFSVYRNKTRDTSQLRRGK
jgi:hypothetical protein